ncbi:hypothetical protein MEG_00226 [Bartonella tamiae Th307]|uniref:HTH cro/C1-type domain-containing protein n=2 Tax=Bartonella tamiae TaxID=373638 RepID=J0R0Q7_9HYPH|nr:hypothetical protein ME5_01655 [Bartonella tamiae Th239]EJF95493.1 hypothetical protein MEG_00226 [Bartonella tamiae Th307]
MFSVTTQMRHLRERAGLSMDELARAMGYKRASSIQRYENSDEFNKEYFSIDLTEKLARVLLGKGHPPIEADEVWALSLPDVRLRLLSKWQKEDRHSLSSKNGVQYSGFAESTESDFIPVSNARIAGNVSFNRDRRLPVYGKAVAGVNGEFEFNGDVLFDVLCPPQLCDVNEAYAVQVSGESMWPRYRDGEIVYCDPTRRVKKGDFVVAQIMVDEHASAPQAFIKMFLRHNAQELVLEQFNPGEKLCFDHERVISVHYIALSGDAM